MENKDAQIIQNLVQEYAKQNTSTPQEADQLILQLAQVVQEDGAKLIHFGNTLFLVLVRDKGVVEFHTLSVNEDGIALSKHLLSLVNYLKNIGAKVVYSYSNDPKFKILAKRVKVFKTQEVKMPNGQDTTAYYVEL
jgi:hypothetical protein